ncbi:MAG TPA: TPM domain-containing protein [Vicinamibacteria bacterium]
MKALWPGMAALLLAVSVPPRPDRYAVDRAGVADAARVSALNERLAQFERQTSTQVLVYVDRRLPANTTLEEFANAAFRAWRVGQKDKDNGVVFFAFVDDRKMKIEVGYGLEGAIPDARARRILDEQVTPRFRAGDFSGGMEAAGAELMKAARGEPYAGTGRTVAEGGRPSGPMPLWIWIVPILGLTAGGLAARTSSNTTDRLVRGIAALGASTMVLSMIATPLANDGRPLALGFGVLLAVGGSVAAWGIGRNSELRGRRAFGLMLLKAAAGLLPGSFALILLSVAAPWTASLAGYAFLLGFPALLLGGLLYAKEPGRILTVLFGRLAFVVMLASAGLGGFTWYLGAPEFQIALDVLVVSAVVWFILWMVARSREWPLLEITSGSGSSGGGWSYSSGGSSDWSSGSSSWSSSDSSSSFSGGGGDSGGGGASGSW